MTRTIENKAIFLDRDGVIIHAPKIKNKPKSIKKINEIKIFYRNQLAIKKLSKFFKIIVITNQPDVSTDTLNAWIAQSEYDSLGVLSFINLPSDTSLFLEYSNSWVLSFSYRFFYKSF